jgi:uncharacterized membrane protein YozB (DUF420 family)
MAQILPHITALLNATALVLLLCGFACIRAGRRDLHRAFMLAAVTASALFLVCYGLHHLITPLFVFRGVGAVRPLYFALLVSHVILAVLVTPAVALVVVRAWGGRFKQHRAVARLTLPVWLYVSVTGIIVYVMLYHLYSGPA